jgi:glycosyltransferase involved in cell wall biosynthesis
VRILFLDQFSDLGGAQLCLRDVLIESRRRGWYVEVMAAGNGPLLAFARECGLAARSLPLSEYPHSRAAAADALRFSAAMARTAHAVQRRLRECRADLVYVNGPRLLPATIRLHAPVMFHAHSVPATRYARAIVRWCLRRANAAALACSQFASQPIRGAIGEEAVRVVYNGCAEFGFRPRLPRHGPLRVGLAGRIAPEKGHLDFLHAASILAGDGGLQFVVAGSALFSDFAYERKIRSLCPAAGVELRGWTADVAGIFRELDILAVPSSHLEASTRVVMEALSAGVCVAAYPSGGLPELIRSGHTGILTSHPDPAALAAAIRTLACNPELRRRLAENGRREWESRFTVERFQREVCDRIEEAAGRRASGASESHCAARATASASDTPPA